MTQSTLTGSGPSTATRRLLPVGHPGLVLALILTAQLMVVLDATIVNIALHDIKNALALLPDRPVLGGQRLHPDLRRPAAARRPGR